MAWNYETSNETGVWDKGRNERGRLWGAVSWGAVAAAPAPHNRPPPAPPHRPRQIGENGASRWCHQYHHKRLSVLHDEPRLGSYCLSTPFLLLSTPFPLLCTPSDLSFSIDWAQISAPDPRTFFLYRWLCFGHDSHNQRLQRVAHTHNPKSPNTLAPVL